MTHFVGIATVFADDEKTLLDTDHSSDIYQRTFSYSADNYDIDNPRYDYLIVGGRFAGYYHGRGAEVSEEYADLKKLRSLIVATIEEVNGYAEQLCADIATVFDSHSDVDATKTWDDFGSSRGYENWMEDIERSTIQEDFVFVMKKHGVYPDDTITWTPLNSVAMFAREYGTHPTVNDIISLNVEHLLPNCFVGIDGTWLEEGRFKSYWHVDYSETPDTPWYQRVLDALEKDIVEAESIGVEAYGMIVDFHV